MAQITYNGITYKSLCSLCNAIGISDLTVRSRLQKGYSLDDALSMPICDTPNSKKAIDHKGIIYNSFEEMCNAYGISRSALCGRLKNGWSLKDALTTPVRICKKIVKDHKGIEYKNFKEMCEKYDVKPANAHARLKKGCSLEEVLTMPYAKREMIKGPNGKEYKSFKALCRDYDINSDTVRRRRLQNGWSLEAALTTASENIILDHNGNAYSSFTEMCRSFNKDTHTVRKRLEKGDSLKEALLTDSKRKCVDHKNIVYDNMLQMCEAYGHRYDTVHDRLLKGASLQKALTTIRPHQFETLIPGIRILKRIDTVNETDYYEVKINNETQIWTADMLFDYRRQIITTQKSKEEKTCPIIS